VRFIIKHNFSAGSTIGFEVSNPSGKMRDSTVI